MAKLLTKSKYMNGLQCAKLLWLVFNDPGKVPPPDAGTQQIFDQGHLVGELAKKLYPSGINVPFTDFRGNLSSTQQLLPIRRPLFEAGFMVNNLFSRLDILKPSGPVEWDIIEVKSTTSLKDEHLQDVAFQKYCAEKAGLKIKRCYLAFINNQYVKQGDIDPALYFTIQDISREVEEVSDGIENRIAAMFKTIALPQCPDIPVGVFCANPYDCGVTCCWEPLSDNSIFTLYRGGQKSFELYYDGILNLRDIPDDIQLNRTQEIQKGCDINHHPHIEVGQIRQFLEKLQPPLYYLDFETISPAVPLFDGIRPYQRVPFQFSLHIGSDVQLQHHGFLAEGAGDPRPAFLRRLKECIGPSGSIVTYNQAFEEGVLKELAEAFPEYAEWIDGLRTRLVDLLMPFRSFHYYHPEQKGSASIKSVLPALTGKSYKGMGISGGEEASAAFLNVTYAAVSQEERLKVRADLEKYCGLDTEGMVWIVEELKAICGV